ncbi:MAG: Na+/H+ antiporter NhaC [bacterium]|nr:Na+/H+ antiporter NhaC [bacterium]
MPSKNNLNSSNIPLWEALLPFLIMMILVIGGSNVLEFPLQLTLLLSVMVAGIFAYRRGIKVPEMLDGIGDTLRKAMPAIVILIAIGAIVGTWMFSGTVPYLIYYGLKLIHPDYLPVTAFLVTAIVSTFTGTSWGSAATSGVAFMGIGDSMGVPAELVAGAVLSGAVFGDKVSPVSDTTNICAMASEISVYDHIRGMLPNVGLAGILAAITFLVFGLMYSGTAASSAQINVVLDHLDSFYHLNPIMLLPPAIVFLGGYKGYPPVVLMLVSSFTAILIGTFLNGFDIYQGAFAMVSGFNTSMVTQSELPALLGTLLNRGGMEGMMSGAVFFCVLAVSFGAIMEQGGFIRPLMRVIFSWIRSAYGLVLAAFFSGGLLNGVSGNAMFSILTTGQMFRGGFRERKLPLSLLSRSMENSMTLLESLIPWHVTALYMSETLGVSTFDYLPFAFFNLFGVGLFFILSKRTTNKVPAV